MAQVIIIDYQSGNLFSVQQALKKVGVTSKISASLKEIEQADALVFPGMGAFGTAMNNIKALGIDESIRHYIKAGKPFLGVCLGMQLLFSNSEEFGDTEGLGIIEGKVSKFPNTHKGELLTEPQIAWNTITPSAGREWQSSPLQQTSDKAYMYFVHSFYVHATDKSVILSETQYGPTTYTSSLLKDNIFACQFHPEKSGEEGLKIYETWAIQNKLIMK